MKDKFRKQAFETPFITKPCPYCGYKKPQLQPYQYGDGLLVKCPECWAITPVKQTWLSAVDAWENGEWSEETVYYANHKRTPESMNDDGAINLACIILEDTAKEYLWMLKKLQTVCSLPKQREEEAKKIAQFEKRYFLENPMIDALPITGEDVIIKLRRKFAEKGVKRTNRSIKDIGVERR